MRRASLFIIVVMITEGLLCLVIQAGDGTAANAPLAAIRLFNPTSWEGPSH